jgi:hypothetical protein
VDALAHGDVPSVFLALVTKNMPALVSDNSNMATPEASNVLAYLDVSDLLNLIGSDEHWP